MAKTKVNVYEVIFKNGKPLLLESVYNTWLEKGITEEQIQLSLNILSQKVLKNALDQLKILNN